MPDGDKYRRFAEECMKAAVEHAVEWEGCLSRHGKCPFEQTNRKGSKLRMEATQAKQASAYGTKGVRYVLSDEHGHSYFARIDAIEREIRRPEEEILR